MPAMSERETNAEWKLTLGSRGASNNGDLVQFHFQLAELIVSEITLCTGRGKICEDENWIPGTGMMEVHMVEEVFLRIRFWKSFDVLGNICEIRCEMSFWSIL